MCSSDLVVIVTPNLPNISETFTQAHIDRLPARVVLAYGSPPRVAGRPVLSRTRRAVSKVWRIVSGTGTDSVTLAYEKVFRRYRACAVLAEYGLCLLVAWMERQEPEPRVASPWSGVSQRAFSSVCAVTAAS